MAVARASTSTWRGVLLGFAESSSESSRLPTFADLGRQSEGGEVGVTFANSRGSLGTVAIDSGSSPVSRSEPAEGDAPSKPPAEPRRPDDVPRQPGEQKPAGDRPVEPGDGGSASESPPPADKSPAIRFTSYAAERLPSGDSLVAGRCEDSRHRAKGGVCVFWSSRSRILAEADHGFWLKPITRSG